MTSQDVSSRLRNSPAPQLPEGFGIPLAATTRRNDLHNKKKPINFSITTRTDRSNIHHH